LLEFFIVTPVMMSALRFSNNPANNLSFPQNLWDAIERLG